MATTEISLAPITSKSLVSGTSRYLKSDVLYYYYNKKNLLTFTTYVRQFNSVSGNETTTLLTLYYQYRPDLLSYDFYGTPGYWWAILELNGIFDIYDFVAGLTIKLPGILQ